MSPHRGFLLNNNTETISIHIHVINEYGLLGLDHHDSAPTVTTSTAWLYLVHTHPPPPPPIVGWVTPGRFKPIR